MEKQQEVYDIEAAIGHCGQVNGQQADFFVSTTGIRVRDDKICYAAFIFGDQNFDGMNGDLMIATQHTERRVAVLISASIIRKALVPVLQKE